MLEFSMLHVLWELIPFPELPCLCVCFALSFDSPPWLLVCLGICTVYKYIFLLTPQRQKQLLQVQLTLPPYICFLIKSPVMLLLMLPPFPPTSLIRQLIVLCHFCPRDAPKQISPFFNKYSSSCLENMDQKTLQRRKGEACSVVEEWSHLQRHDAPAAGTALKRGVGLKGCSHEMSGSGFAFVMLCGRVLV